MLLSVRIPSILKTLVLFLCTLGLVYVLPGCSGSDHPSESSELNFGLPGKSDQTCDRRSALCWSESEVSLAQTLMEKEMAYLTQEGSWQDLKSAILNLEYKLNDQEKKALHEAPFFLDRITYTLNSK